MRIVLVAILSLFPLALNNNANGSITEISATVGEGQVLRLSAPEGFKIHGVAFASYGTPANYTIGKCHAANSTSIVQAYIKNESLVISATNGIFGDPCGGTYKKLSVVLSIEPIPASEPLILNSPSNLIAVIDEVNQSVLLSWSAPTVSNVSVERYAISWSTGSNGWGIATGNVGDSNALNTSITIPISVVNTDGLDKVYSFNVRSDNDTLGVYSNISNISSVYVNDPARIAAEIEALAEEERLKAEAEAKAKEEARLQAEAAALLAAQQEAARLAAIAEQERLAELERQRLAAIAEAARLAEIERQKLEAEAAAKAEAERLAKIEAERIAAELKAKAEEEARLKAESEAEAERLAKIEAERLAAEEAKKKDEEEKLAAEAKAKSESDRLAAEIKAKQEADRIAAEKAEEERLEKIAAEAKAGKELSKEEVAAVVTSLVADLKPGESISAAQVQASGVSYSDLPASTPIEVRTDENGNALVITAEVAANIELVQDPGALLEAAFSDPGAALQALGSIGADMTTEEREEATEMVVATVVAAGAAINAAAVAAGGATGGGSGGGSSGGGSGANSPVSRGGRKW